MVNRASRDEKLGAWEPCRLKLAIIKTLKTAQSDGLRGPVRAEWILLKVGFMVETWKELSTVYLQL